MSITIPRIYLWSVVVVSRARSCNQILLLEKQQSKNGKNAKISINKNKIDLFFSTPFCSIFLENDFTPFFGLNLNDLVFLTNNKQYNYKLVPKKTLMSKPEKHACGVSKFVAWVFICTLYVGACMYLFHMYYLLKSVFSEIHVRT